jgi:hypothetical protein
MLGLLLLAHGALAQSISGSTSVAQGQQATYTFNSSCSQPPTWTINPSGLATVISQSGNSITIRWDVAGTRYLTAQASGCSGPWIQSATLTVNVASPYWCVVGGYTPNGRPEGCDGFIYWKVCNMVSTCGYTWTIKPANQSPYTRSTSTNVLEISGCSTADFEYICVQPSCGGPSFCWYR